jgi:2-polyprenyl-3-methyl-5-hydroxy-6-metoxy-1,4-benzoquinol methylase
VLSTHAVAQGVARGLDLTAGMLEAHPTEAKYDCITAYDVLEHVLEPWGFLQAVTERLKPGGYAVLSLPNVASIFAKVMRSRW